jgi:hypothetical protein
VQSGRGAPRRGAPLPHGATEAGTVPSSALRPPDAGVA